MESRIAVVLLAVLPMMLAAPNAYGGYSDGERKRQASVGDGEPMVEYVFTETGPFRYDNIRNTVSSPTLHCSADYYFDNGKMFVRMTLDGMFEVSSVSVTVGGHNDGRYEKFISPVIWLKDQNREPFYRVTGVDQDSGENVQVTVSPGRTDAAAIIEAQVWQRGYGCPLDITLSFN